MYGMTSAGKLFADEFTEWLLEAISMHHIEQKLLIYIMSMIVSIGIHMKLSENGLWTL